MSEIRYGVIGMQWAGKTHAKAASQVEGVRIAAVCDVNEQAAKAVAAEYPGAKVFLSYEEMLTSGEVDAVSVCTPHWLHCPMVVAAAKAKKHVLVEKPISITVKEADTMVKAAKKAGAKLAVSHQYRLNKTWWTAKQLLPEIGDIYRAVLVVSTPRTQEYYGTAAWRGTWAQEGGGVLINQTVHHLDYMRWCLPPITELSAFANTLTHKIEVEDVVAASASLANGGVFSIQLSTVDFPGGAFVEFAGSKGTLRIADRLRLAKAPENKWQDIEPQTAPLGEGHGGILKDFITAIRENREPFVTGEQGTAALEIVNAVILSHVTRKRVKFPISRAGYERVYAKLREAKKLL